jgi:uncharacterized membrane-anchored protein
MDGDRTGGIVSVAAGQALVQHPMRDLVLREIHARPFQVMTTPRLVLHYAFSTDAVTTAAAREDLLLRCDALGVRAPDHHANQHIVWIGAVRLRWETHSEITTYTWDCPGDDPASPLTLDEVFGAPFRQPGPLIVAVRLDLVKDDAPAEALLHGLDPGSTAVSSMRDGRAIGATDFKLRPDGLTRILVVDRGLYPHEVGALVQRLIELETYRTLALLGLPEARRLQPAISRIELSLQDTIQKMSTTPDLNANRVLLAKVTELAAEVEMEVALSAFRFGASRAYDEIVKLRLRSIRETPLDGYTRWSSFLERRMAPAMRTCHNVEARQQELSVRIGRAANLLRTRIEVELEQQNRELLSSLNRRAKMQFRLQQWVEGLSVAAVSYYVVGLVSYLAAGAESAGWVDRYLVTALAVPPVVLGIWWFVRRLRARHGGHEDEDESGRH